MPATFSLVGGSGNAGLSAIATLRLPRQPLCRRRRRQVSADSALEGVNLALKPYRGDKILIDSVAQTVPLAGVTLAPTA